ncbi:hypothetical protein STCU_09610 [Strigomonas culicis]|uniref:Guanylate cyclase domain-containing protein n=1 Tax=Strigomonas culicis TaxID=28005 RepID=S9TRL6_9TRYP|nr:hypothetical protein STCU_09610 [Strigomonas culicis]|eukprot:EPY19113.1 hypothetical protein STCU_09610 [Strigomonas culicis]
MALKEKEIEELMRLCSNLRTELGNAKSDARFLEFAILEKSKAQIKEKDDIIAELEKKLAAAEKTNQEVKDNTEHQIRLLTSQHENSIQSFKSEARLASERCADLTKTYQSQVEDIKTASKKELEYIENRFNARVEELTAELRSVRTMNNASESHYLEQTAATKSMLSRIEADYKERLRASEQRIEELRKTHDEVFAFERKGKEAALEESRKATEQLAAALVDKDELVQRYNLWNNYILAALDKYYHGFISALPAHVVDPVDPQLQQVPELYAPRAVLEDPEAKVVMERIAYRLLQLKVTNQFDTRTEESAQTTALPSESHLEQLINRQERLKKAITETETSISQLDATCGSVLTRLYFFSDNLEQSIANAPRNVLAPVKNVVFVCLSIYNGQLLWADDADTMRTAVILMHSTIRLKLSEYGGYEAFSDDVSMLLAFDDAAGACRFCTESQMWLMHVPWPAALLSSPFCVEERGDDQRPIFRGIRLAMAMHAGESVC